MSIALERPPMAVTVPDRPPLADGAALAASLDLLPDPSFLIDDAGRIARANKAAERVLGRAHLDVASGTPFLDLWDGAAAPIVRATLTIAARETGRFDSSLRGHNAAFDVALSPAGEDGMVLAVCRDVTGLAGTQAAPAAPAPAPAAAEPEPVEPPPPAMPEETFAEIDHRLRNLFAMVPSLVKLSMRNGGDINAVHKAITGRVAALSRANSLSLRPSGLSEGVSLDAIIAVVLDRGQQDERIVSSGPPVRLATRAYNAVALTLHELATNALTHGALCEPGGRLRIAWAIEEEARDGAMPEDATGCLRLLWTETGGPHIDAAPRKRGFGTTTVDKLIASQGGTIEREWRLHGLSVTMDLPLYDLGAEPKYARTLQPPPVPQVRGGAGKAKGSTGARGGAVQEHVAPPDPQAERDAVMEARILEKLDRIIAGTRH